VSGLALLRGRVAVLAAVIVALLVTGTWVALSHASAHTYRPHAAAAAAAAAAGAGARQHSASQARAVPLQVLTVTPAARATGVNGAAPISVVFSAALAPGSPMPRISPRIAGRWQRAPGNALQFLPATGFRQLTRVRVRIPAGRGGVRSASGGLLSAPVTVRFSTGAYSTTRLDQLLAKLGYLPLTWIPANSREASAPSSGAAPGSQAGTSAVGAAYDPPAGYFRWHHGYPAELKRFWDGGDSSSLILKGAVMAFEADHGMQLDGIAGPAVWNDLFAAVATGQDNAHGYTYAIARESLPETLTIWHDGRLVLHTLANTGIPGRSTVAGTFPVYLRFLNTIMKGTNPDGTKYSDHVQFVSYFNGGDAVHYFVRGSYGFPQSLGCVELPYSAAVSAWPLLTYGSLVTVNPPG
jgi:hypothetical protein